MGQLAYDPAKHALVRNRRLLERSTGSNSVFDRLGDLGAQKVPRLVKDEAQSEPRWADQVEHDLTLALKLHHSDLPKGSAVCHGDLPSGEAVATDPCDLQVAALTRTVQQLLERMEKQDGAGGIDPLLGVPDSPLGALVTLAPTQRKIGIATLDRYSGGTDPRVHVAKYNSYMVSMGATDGTKCRLFSLTLSDQAHQWFTSLPPLSVDTFEQLTRLFLTHFIALAPRPATR